MCLLLHRVPTLRCCWPRLNQPPAPVCLLCAVGLSTPNDAASQVSIDNCTLAPGYGFYDDTIQPCPLGECRSQSTWGAGCWCHTWRRCRLLTVQPCVDTSVAVERNSVSQARMREESMPTPSPLHDHSLAEHQAVVSCVCVPCRDLQCGAAQQHDSPLRPLRRRPDNASSRRCICRRLCPQLAAAPRRDAHVQCMRRGAEC